MKRIRCPRLVLILTVVIAAGAVAVLGGVETGARAAGGPEPEPGVLLAAGPAPAATPAGRGSDGDETHRAKVHVCHIGEGSWLGVRIAEITEETVSDLRLDRPYGVLVRSVEEDSPAEKSGIREDDVIVGYEGEKVPGTAALRRMVRETPAGRSVEIELIRDGRLQKVQVEIEGAPSRRRIHRFGSLEDEDLITIPHIEIPDIDVPEIRIPEIRIPRLLRVGRPRLGVGVYTLNEQLAEHFGVSDGEGVLVTEVMEDTPAERAGLKAGDVIVRVEGRRIEDVGDLHDELRDHEGETVTVTVVRDRSERRLEVTLERPTHIEDEEDSRLLRDEMLRLVEERAAHRAAARGEARVYREEMQRHREEMQRHREERRKIMRELRRSEEARSRPILVQI